MKKLVLISDRVYLRNSLIAAKLVGDHRSQIQEWSSCSHNQRSIPRG